MTPETTKNADCLRGHSRTGEFYEKGWYHSFQLPDGTKIDGIIPVARLQERLKAFGLPANLAGKRVLDIGCWDGWFSFALEGRGAEVVAVDCVEMATFLYIHRKLQSKVRYLQSDVIDLSASTIGYFDIVLCLGVVYHLKHPLLALEKVCELTRGIAVIDSFVVDNLVSSECSSVPILEFYEGTELGGQMDNWFGPTSACLSAMCRTAGFPIVRAIEYSERACVICERQWPAGASGTAEPPQLLAATHSRNYGINFRSGSDDYLTCWFGSEEDDLVLNTVFGEVGPFGAAPVFVRKEWEQRWLATFRLPPGLPKGWADVRIFTSRSGYSNSLKIAVDMPAVPAKLAIEGLSDGSTWEKDVVRQGGHLSLWLTGCPLNADRGNIRVYINGINQTVLFVGPEEDGMRQINVAVSDLIEPGECLLEVRPGEFGPAPEIADPLLNTKFRLLSR